MRMQEISNTGINVSPLCLGTMTFGTPVAEREAIKIVHWALDHGINFIDTADIYEGYARRLGSPGGVAETILGVALRDRRKDAVITTKVGNPVGDDFYQGTGLNRPHMVHQIDASLQRLGADYVDFYELHKADPDTPLEESIATMVELMNAGKVRHWGFSNFAPAQIECMLRLCARNSWPMPVIAQPLYNWLDRSCEQEYLPLCHSGNIAVTPYQPLQGGLLTGKYQKGVKPPESSRAVEHPQWIKLEDGTYDCIENFLNESKAADLAPVQYALRWLLQKQGVVSVIAGIKNITQLEEMMSAVL